MNPKMGGKEDLVRIMIVFVIIHLKKVWYVTQNIYSIYVFSGITKE